MREKTLWDKFGEKWDKAVEKDQKRSKLKNEAKVYKAFKKAHPRLKIKKEIEFDFDGEGVKIAVYTDEFVNWLIQSTAHLLDEGEE